MKRFIGVFAGLLFFCSCVPPTKLGTSSTETYLKNNIQQHEEGKFSSLRILNIYNGICFSGRAIEFTAYKHNNQKGMVLAGSIAVPQQQGVQNSSAVHSPKSEGPFIIITEYHARMILDNYKLLQEKIKGDKAMMKEVVYHDFTASNELFVSYSRSYNAFSSTSTMYVDLWIKGNKFTMYSTDLVKWLEEFVAY